MILQLLLSTLPNRRTAIRHAPFASWILLPLSLAMAQEPPSKQGVEYFEKHIRPILVEHCYECHSAKDVKGGLRLDHREAVLLGGDSGPALVAKEPDKSLLLEAVSYKNRDLQMPPKNPLPPSHVELLREWIAMGAPDPREAPTTPAIASPMGMSIEEGRRFWSMQPIANPTVPRLAPESSSEWIRTPIDAFLLEAMTHQGLTPTAPADKRSLIRRATYDLIGLPPTPEEIATFLDDESPDAFDRVVDRLLQSPEYGIRWGRHWLDVARYADSNGLDENLAYGTAWRYRDYVVDSFNRDKPIDRFIIEQLAGDLLPDANVETRIGTGFLVLGAKVLAEPDREKLMMDTIDEQIDTMGKALLGMTLGCVRCHDHKFDPIKQTDYYGLAAIFKSTKTFGDTNFGAIKHWNEHVLATADELAKIKEVDAQIAAKQKVANDFKAKAFQALRTKTRGLAAKYLAAAASIAPTATLPEIEVVAKPLDLHPRILHHCRRHLEFHREDPFFRKWHELAAQDPSQIESHYASLFQEADAAWEEAKKNDPKVTKLEQPHLEEARLALADPSGFLAIPAKPSFALDEETFAEYDKLADEARILESFSPDIPSAMGVREGNTVGAIPLHIRGSHRNLGAPIARQLPEAISSPHARPIFPRTESGRLQLAQWIASDQNPLTARVFVNRIWGWHFGQAIVPSTENFGVLGDRPSHPELLDWLARYCIEMGWSTKQLHRMIMTSSAYQSSVLRSPNMRERDPENRWLASFPSHRLDAEQIRDSILAVSGQLDRSHNGKSVPLRNRQFVFDHTSIDHTKYDSVRRAIYLPVIRNNLYVHFEQFDFPDPTMPTGHRQTSTVAPQALQFLNSEWIMNAAQALARDLEANQQDIDRQIVAAFISILGREPSPQEMNAAKSLVEKAVSLDATVLPEERDLNSPPPLSGLAMICQGLMMSNEFLYLR